MIMAFCYCLQVCDNLNKSHAIWIVVPLPLPITLIFCMFSILLLIIFIVPFNAIFSLSLPDRERARYEASVHLGNASQSSSDDRRRMIESSVNGLKKNVSKTICSRILWERVQDFHYCFSTAGWNMIIIKFMSRMK